MPEDWKPARIILVADGSDGFLDAALKEALAPTEYVLLHVQDAVDAATILELLKSNIDLAIIDENFPTASGFDLIGRLAMRNQPSPAKIIITTHEQGSPQLATALVIDAVVSTPILPEEWRKTIETLLTRRKASGSF